MQLVFSPMIRQYALVVTVNFAILTSGMSVAWPSPSIVKLRDPIETPLSRPITVEEGSWIVSSGLLIATFTSILGGVLIDVVGRKNFILLVSIPKLCMTLLLIFANEVWMFIVCRVIMIVADCFLCIVVPIYSSEIASNDQRGVLGALFQLFLSTGLLFSLSVGPFLSYKTFSVVYASVVTALTVPLLFLPETPFHMYSKGRLDEAMRTLKTIRDSEKLATKELEEYINFSNEKKLDKSALFKNKTFLKALSLGVLLSIGSQIIGMTGVNFYLQVIMEATKTSVPSEIASVVAGAIQALTCACTTLIMNMFGRRTILLWSLVGYFIGMLGLGTFFMITEPEDYVITGLMNYLPIVSIIVIIIFYHVGIGSLLWVIVSELFEGPSRATGVTISITTAIFTAFIIAKYFALLTSSLGPALTYWLFCLSTVLLFIIIAIFLPETKGKTFGEIQIALGGHVESQDVKSEQ